MKAKAAILACLCFFLPHVVAGDFLLPGEPGLELPAVGAYQARLLSPTILEISLVANKAPDPAPVQRWNFVTKPGQLVLPDVKRLSVRAGSQEIEIKAMGFKRRPLYAPLKQRDLRLGNFLYLQLSRPVPENVELEIKNSDGTLWPASAIIKTTSDPRRWSPVWHANQVGYAPALPKIAMLGYYLGSLGELDVSEARTFKLMERSTGKAVFEGTLHSRPDKGFTFSCYQHVLEADFSKFNTPGQYRLEAPGFGVSHPFLIDEGTPAALARTYALGLYHQRCGTSNELPFTRFVHGPCHTAPAEIPLPETNFSTAWRILAQKTSEGARNPRQTAPQLTNDATSVYPFIKRGKIDVAGGHHDAGDYSKYTVNSAGLIHHLVFAADVLPGVSDLDNLGLPESGDGKSDVLQEAKWEADFLAKLQDDDGGFFFLVYPREREYESNVTSDKGDPQIVWPKNTAATAAAVAALAQCASSPRFKKEFPAAAKAYQQKAKKGWSFLENAIAKRGKDGAYQKITHYGDEFMHDDELTWAACEMFLATGDQSIHRKLLEWLNPTDPNTRKWGWWRLYDAYGCAIRSYAFAVPSGKIKQDQLDIGLLAKCEGEIIANAEDQLRRARDSAYGTSFPIETKRVRAGGWYFSTDAAFDLAVASQLSYPSLNDPRPQFLEALMSNLNYEAGCNPVNITYVTGLGCQRQRVIVHQNALNYRQSLPPSGIPISNLQAGFGWLDLYKRELGEMGFPPDGREADPYPIYDRWCDTWNVSTEFVVLNLGRALGATAWLMAQTSLKSQPWKSASAHITALHQTGKELTARLEAPDLDLSQALTVWESRDSSPVFGSDFSFTPTNSGPRWIEAEAQLPDGRRVFGATNVPMQAGSPR